MTSHSLTSLLLARLSQLLLPLLLLFAIGCGGGGGGTTPAPDPPTGTVSGQIVLGAGLPILPQGDGSRGSTRIIDPQDIIASMPAAAPLGSDGRFTISNVPASATVVYLQVRFSTAINLVGGGAGSTPVAINIPVLVGDAQTSTIASGIDPGQVLGVTQGLTVATTYTGPDGKRESRSFINFGDDTLAEDLNGDGNFDDNQSPDDDNDCISDDRNGYDDNPGSYSEIEETGAITALTNDSVTVNGVHFLVTGSTVIFGDDDDEPLLLSDFNIGDFIEAEGFMLPGTTDVLAKKIKSEDRPDDDDPVNPNPGTREVEREGLLLAKTANTVTVLDITFIVNASTIILNKDSGATITLNDIPVGGCLDAKGNRTDDGIIATRLRYDDSCDDDGTGGFEIEVQGRITAIDNDGAGTESITVNGKTFEVVLPIPIVDDETEDPIAFSSLQVDDFVEVKGIQSPTSLLATRIELDDEDDDPPTGGVQIEREGTCQARTATTITVLNTTFTVPATGVEIVIKDTDEPIAFSSIQVGEDIDVRGIQNGTSLIANRIRVDREDD